MLTAQRLRTLLDYEPENGEFRWKGDRAPNAKAGDEAGFIHRDGYRYIRIGRRQYAAHRLAWLYVTGEAPTFHLDHRDMDRTNNRFVNLRPASPSQNQANRPKQANNTSGFKGAYWQGRSGKWEAKVRLNGKLRYLGSYPSPEEAHAAYSLAAKEAFGEFARAG